MTPPSEKDEPPKVAPLEDAGTARHLVHLGMDANAARTFAAYHSGAYAAFRRRPQQLH